MGTFEILCVVMISVAEMALGIACGWWLKERRAVAPEQSQEQLQKAFMRLAELARHVTDNVDDHSSRMDTFNRELAGMNGNQQDLGDSVLAVVERIATANSMLQNKLAVTQEQMREQSHQLDMHINEARVDVLTELANRRAFNDELSRRYAELQRTGNPFSLLVADIDHFKRVNDTFGHDAGDLVLKGVANALRETVRDMDLVARYGGEEFAILLPMTDIDRAKRAAERAREAVEKIAFDGEMADTRVTISIGFSQAMTTDATRELFGRADLALYSAKQAGRNCCRTDDVLATTEAAAPQAPTPVVDLSEAPQSVDAITGLPNRRQFVDELRVAATAARKNRTSLSLILIALDHIDKLKATHPQREIDHLLMRMASTLTAHVRDNDRVLRYGWEEFAVLMPAASGVDAVELNDRLRECLGKELAKSPITPIPTLSSGVCEMRNIDDPVNFASRAEAELDKARSLGGNQSSQDGIRMREPATV